MKFYDNNLSQNLIDDVKRVMEGHKTPHIKFDEQGAHVVDGAGKVVKTFKPRDKGSNEFKKEAQNYLTKFQRSLNASFVPQEGEQIDEISDAKKVDYIKKAYKDITDKEKSNSRETDLLKKRREGVRLARSKLGEEESVEEELSAGQKKLPPALQKAIAKKQGDKKPVDEKMDPVGKEDGDIDNDGDKDSSDTYLKNRRKKIAQAMKKENYAADAKPKKPKNDKETANDKMKKDFGEEKKNCGCGKDPCETYGKQEESKDMNTTNAAAVVQHDCAKHVHHEEYGDGECVPGMHTIVEKEDSEMKCEHCDGTGKHDDEDCKSCNGTGVIKEGFVTHYDVMFENEDGYFVVENIAVEDLQILSEMSHGHPKKKK